MNRKTLIIYQNKIIFNILNELFFESFELIFLEKKEFKKYRVSNENQDEAIISDKLIDRIISTNKADIDLKKHIESEFKNILDNYKLNF